MTERALNSLNSSTIWLWVDLNHRPRPYERRALTPELQSHTSESVREGFEPSEPVTVRLVSSELTSATHPPHQTPIRALGI